ncbi:MAG: hypothetical protein KatS3mg019_0032 [Fimbriimonadales bacterium]|nr:MAG: hypothetical protein KatS3mg019_0032 [Fimbriimonadales bacterium]
MRQRTIKINSAIVQEFETRKVPSSHPFWLEMASTYIDSVVVRHLRNIIESPQSDPVSVSRALSQLARGFLYGEIRLTKSELESYRRSIRQSQSGHLLSDSDMSDVSQDVLAAFGDPDALETALKNLKEGRLITPLELIAIHRWRPSASRKHFSTICQRSKKSDEWLSLLGYLIKRSDEDTIQNIRIFLLDEIKRHPNELSPRNYWILQLFLLGGEKWRTSSEFHRFLRDMFNLAVEDIRKLRNWNYTLGLDRNISLIIYYSLRESEWSKVNRWLQKIDGEPIHLTRVMLQSFLGDQQAHHQWVNWIQECNPVLRWLRLPLTAMAIWFADLHNTGPFDQWLDKQCLAVRKGIEQSKTANWKALLPLGGYEASTSAHGLLLQYMILTCIQEGIQRWLHGGIPEWTGELGGTFFSQLNMLLP